MATLVPVKNKAGKPTGSWQIWFYDAGGKRRQFRPGKMKASDAREWCDRIDRLAHAVRHGRPLHPTDDAWLGSLSPAMVDKLAAFGLVTVTESLALGEYLDRYVAQRADTKSSTRTVYGHTRRTLIAYFGADKPLRSITRGDADDWRLYLLTEARKRGADSEADKGLADNTVRRRCGIAKQFFHAAVRKGLIDSNPFGDLVAAVHGNAARFAFISREDATKVLAACPDAEWRLIFALSRFGGLRCPSEHLKLTWGHVDFERGRLTIPQPKLEHLNGKATRPAPMFPEVREYLEEVAYLAMGATGRLDPEAFVITRYRDSNVNLRTQLLRILKKAKVDPWPKLFQNLRSTRETELAEQYPLHVVTAWLGNSQLVAAKHYLQVTDQHFERAIAAPASPAGASEPERGADDANAGDAKREAQNRSEQASRGDDAGTGDAHSEPEGGARAVARNCADQDILAQYEIEADECALKNPAYYGVLPHTALLSVSGMGDEGLEPPTSTV